MVSVKSIKNHIKSTEGFNVNTPFRLDKRLDFTYGFKRAAPNKLTVAQFIRQRMQDIPVDILNGCGEPVHGRTLLSTVRRSYT
jgi:hypothetical protein